MPFERWIFPQIEIIFIGSPPACNLSTGSKPLREAAKNLLGGNPNNAKINVAINSMKNNAISDLKSQKQVLEVTQKATVIGEKVNNAIGTNVATKTIEEIKNQR